jgi:hypothetical protein
MSKAAKSKAPQKQCVNDKCGAMNHARQKECKKCGTPFPQKTSPPSAKGKARVNAAEKGLALAKVVFIRYGGNIEQAIKAVNEYKPMPDPVGELIAANGGKESTVKALQSLSAT